MTWNLLRSLGQNLLPNGLGGPNLFLLGLFIAPVSEIQTSENQKRRLQKFGHT